MHLIKLNVVNLAYLSIALTTILNVYRQSRIEELMPRKSNTAVRPESLQSARSRVSPQKSFDRGVRPKVRLNA